MASVEEANGPWTNPDEPGRLDVDGAEWWRWGDGDPLSAWYRHEGEGALWRAQPRFPGEELVGRVSDPGERHCATCRCGCTCGYGGFHEELSPHCELNS